jgi:hypothetical protein
MEYFKDIESVVRYNPNIDQKKILVTREGQTGQIQKISFTDRSEMRERYSFYGSLTPFDLEYLPKKI